MTDLLKEIPLIPQVLKPEYVHPDWEKFIPPYNLYRFEKGGIRWYYELTDNGPVFYPSETSHIKLTRPTSKYLIDWKVRYGEYMAGKILSEAADYGTVMHVTFKDWYTAHVIGESLDIDKVILTNLALASLYENREACFHSGGVWITDPWRERLHSDLRAFIKWLQDYEVKIYMMEVILRTEKWKVAGAMDILCEMNDKNYTDKTPPDKRKRVIAEVDLKSGGIYPDHADQLAGYGLMWHETFPAGPKIERYYNWSPKEWRKEPTYEFKDWTDTIQENQKRIEHYLQINLLDLASGALKPPTVKEFNSTVNPDHLTDSYLFMEAGEWVQKQFKK